MPGELEWLRVGYTSRIDVLADEIDTFVAKVLATIDVSEARASRAKWAAVCRFFAGCARAARAQGQTPERGGTRIVKHLKEAFPCEEEGSNDGFYELMDWLSKAEAFRATRLRYVLANM